MKIKRKTALITFMIGACALLASCQSKQNNLFQGYADDELIYFSAALSGKLFTLNVYRGEKIHKGATIFTLDPEPEISQLSNAKKQLAQAEANLNNLIKGQRNTIIASIQAQIDQSKADLELADLRVKRFQALYSKNAIDKDTVDASIARYKAVLAQKKQLEANLAEATLGSREDLIKAQQATVAAANATLQQAEWAYSQKTVVALNDGIIFDTFFLPGEWVASGQPVAALLTTEQMRFIFFVPEPTLAQIHIGETVSVSCDSCTKNYNAVIEYISPTAEYMPPLIYSRENNYKLVYQVKAKPSNADALFFKPGQPVYITLPAVVSKNAT